MTNPNAVHLPNPNLCKLQSPTFAKLKERSVINFHVITKLDCLRYLRVMLLIAAVVSGSACVGYAQDNLTPPPSAAAQSELAQQQKLLAEQFAKMEELFLRMSELESSTNPSRSGLLQQAAKLSKELATLQRMSQASDLLGQKQFTRALQEQQASRDSLAKLLELLQSENRHERVREERERIQQLIKDIKRIERLQKSLRGRTENGADMEQAKKDQGNVEEQTSELESALAKELNPDETSEQNNQSDPNKNPDSKDPKKPDQTDDPKAPSDPSEKSAEPKSDPTKEPAEQDPSKQDPPEQTPKDNAPSEQNPSEQNPSDPNQPQKSDQPPSDQNAKPSENSQGEPSKQPPGQSESSQDEQQEQNPSDAQQQPKSPEQQAQKRVEAAREKMKAAEKKLEEANRKDAVEEQRNAEKELAKAVEDLEKVLRQLREEEIDRSLAALESRFRKMLEMQTIVLDETKKLDALTGDARDRQVEIGASKLSLEERKILVEGQRAMLLLKEEGSSDAFPQVVEQILLDVESVTERLSKSDVSESTIATEEDIVAALEEMIEALSKAQKDQEKKKQQQQQQQQQAGQSPADQPLVDALAELRLVKTLQVRINNRTQRLAKQIAAGDAEIGQATTVELQSQLKELAARQDKIKEITRNIVLKAQEQ